MSNPFSAVTNFYGNIGKNIDPFNPNGKVGGFMTPPTYQQTPYQAPQQSAADINAMRAALGITAPEDNRQQAQNAAFGALDNQGQVARAMSDQSMASRGLYKSGTAGAKLDQINTDLAGQKANVTAMINQNHAQNKQGYDMAAMQAALSAGNSANSFNQGENQYAFMQNEAIPYEQRMQMLQSLLQMPGQLAQGGMNAYGQATSTAGSILPMGI